MKHMKTLGLLVLAVMALAAFASTASAHTEATFTSSKVGANLIEETKANHVFTITGSKVECTNVDFVGKTESIDTNSQLVHPVYTGCTAFGFAATIDINNCKFTLKGDGTVALLKTDTAGAACSIVITVKNVFAECEATVGEQSIANAVSYTNSGTSPSHITVHVNNAANIHATVKKSSGLCPLTVGTHTNSHYTGESTVKAEGASISWDATIP